MNLDQTLRQLNDHHNDDIANFAADAHDLYQQYSTGEISADEFQDLLRDLDHGRAISAAAADLDTQITINQVMQGLFALINH